MDETGHPGHAVPGSDSGTNHPREAVPHGWTHLSAQLRARHNGAVWSPGEAALDPVTDPPSTAWPGAGGYEPAGYPVAPVATQVPVGTGYEAPPAPSRAGNEPTPAVAAFEGVSDSWVASAGGASDAWVDWQSTPLPPGHMPLSAGMAGDDHTPPRGIPAAPASGPPAAPPSAPPADAPGDQRGAEPRRGAHAYEDSGPGELPPADQWRPEVLPQRVPAQPDVPALPAGVAEEAGVRAEAPELARIATYLRHDEAPPAREAFDVDAVLAAVREVDGVRGAELRRNPNGVHTLRLDLVDGADGGQVSRMVARLLSERMGLSASPGPPSAVNQPSPAAQQPWPAAQQSLPATDEPTRRSAGTAARGRATVPTVPQQPGPHRASRPLAAPAPGMRAMLDHVQVSTFGLDATVEVRLTLGERRAVGEAHGPAVDGYVLRLCAVSAAEAIDRLLVDPATGRSRGRCFVEHAALVPFGTGEVAVAVVLLVCDGWVEPLAGAAIVTGDPRQAVVRATVDAANRRLESLLH